MLINSIPDTLTKLTQMGDVTLYEPAGDQPQAERRRTMEADQPRDLSHCISHVSTPTGSKPVLKTMLTTACERNCFYCPFRAGRSSMERMTIRPDEMARAFDTLQTAGKVDGLFLSSGIIKGGVSTTDKIIDTAEILRKRYHYRGYIHLKIMPGSEYEQVYRAMQLADRVSVNLEAPTQARLDVLAPKKHFEAELLQMLRWAAHIRKVNPGQKLANTVTQFVVGAVGDTDLELLSLSERLYRQIGLARAYYSAFHPIEQTPLENVTPTEAVREFRLYQASFLLRDYAWDVEELPFEGTGNLRTDVDPKMAWAERHLLHAPIEIMTAEREQLLRVPGIGPKTADAIMRARQRATIRDAAMLRKLGLRAPERALPYVLLDGRREWQPGLF